LGQNFFTSGHHFTDEETQLKFQFRMLNGMAFIVAMFSYIFAVLNRLNINDIGLFQEIVDYFFGTGLLLGLWWLRYSKDSYIPSLIFILTISWLTFTSTLINVPQDEFRIIWYYLLIFVSYNLGGVRIGNIFSGLSLFIVIALNMAMELHISSVAMTSAVFGMIIAMLVSRIYSKKVQEYEDTLIHQKKILETFNSALEAKVAQKTAELRELNNSLEIKVQEKVDEVKEQEKMLIAQSRLAAMGEMLSMIAHQWRQPLATMTLMISNAKIASMMSETPSKESKMLDEISDTLIYLSDTIDDFQTYFEPQKKTETVEISKLLERVVHFTKTRFRMNNVALFTSGKTDVTIETYGSELVQILINLLNNAVDAIVDTEPTVRHVMISCTERDNDLLMVVEDSGGGIDDEIISKVFEPYFSTKSKNGTGLGLYMAKMIIESHIGGSISVKNGQSGAIFTIVLPKTLQKNGAN
jgi:C4-dicarboxylate-specific signal transduction histidine kinase